MEVSGGVELEAHDSLFWPWAWRSMKPGQTTRPVQSRATAASAGSTSSPTAAIRSPAIATFVIGPPAGRAGYAGKRVAPDPVSWRMVGAS